MSTLPISEAIIRHNSNASSYSRGEEYYKRGAVYDVKKRGNYIQASVEGSELKQLAEYGGDCYSIAEPLNIAWTEAILCEDMPQVEAINLQVMLESWQDEIDADFAMSLTALQQGWNYEPLERIMAGDTSVQLWQERPDFADDLTAIRLDFLLLQNRFTEYLNLAFAEGMMQQYLTQLTALGQVDEAMSAAKTQMDTAETAFALAIILRDDGYLSEALEIGRLGLHLPGNRIYEFASWTSDFAGGIGDTSTALNASMVAFEAKPSFRDYQKAENLAAEAWSQIKPDLLEILRESKHWYAERAKVDIFLHEGLIDEAIATVRSDSYYTSELLEQVMDAAIPYRPD